MTMLQTTCCRDHDHGTENRGLRDKDKKERLRCWEVDHFFKCPIVGMCLSPAEQKHLLKKAGVLDKRDGDYDIHEKLVASLETENRLSRRMDNLLERKFAKQARALRGLDAKVFLEQFKTAMAAGDGAGCLWAAGTHPALPIECRREIFGEIHMAMHWSADERLKCYRKLSRQEDELDRLRRQAKTQARNRRTMIREINDLQHRQVQFKDEIAALNAENHGLKTNLSELTDYRQLQALSEEAQRLKGDCASLAARLETALTTVATLETENRRLASQLDAQCEQNRRVCEQTRAIIGEMASLNHCDSSCPAYDLCRKRILIVGGITRMETIYRELIESRGGCFDYHDGYVKKGSRELENRFKRADVVLCPVNCNSHAACSMVKNLGKKHNKPVYMLPNSSLSTVSQVIWGDDAERCALN